MSVSWVMYLISPFLFPWVYTPLPPFILLSQNIVSRQYYCRKQSVGRRCGSTKSIPCLISQNIILNTVSSRGRPLFSDIYIYIRKKYIYIARKCSTSGCGLFIFPWMVRKYLLRHVSGTWVFSRSCQSLNCIFLNIMLALWSKLIPVWFSVLSAIHFAPGKLKDPR